MMLDTLRRRFIVSHALPLLIIIPLMGMALTFVLETQVLLVSLAKETQEETVLLSEIATDDPAIWSNATLAQAFVGRIKRDMSARIMLLDSQGRLLSSSDSGDSASLGRPLAYSGLSEILSGQVIVQTDYGQELDTATTDAFLPVEGSSHQVLGVIRLTHRLAGVYDEFFSLRFFIAIVLTIALVLGTAVGLVLALNLERPLRQLTQSVHDLSSGQQLTALPEQGPREVRLLLHAFNTMAERLRSLEEARRRLLSNLVHELGTPLAVVNSGIEALRGGAAEQPDLRQDLLAGMEDEVRHLRRLLDDLAGLYDRILGTVKLKLEPLALEDWLARNLATWHQAAQAKGLHWEAHIAPSLPLVRADPDRLAQILGNLVSNAIKFTRAGGTVSVTADLDGDGICMTVSDTGVGIPPDEQTLIFNPFYKSRLGGRFYEGMGLGLAIARDLAIAHAGRLEVKSTPGQGSRFMLWLPIKPST
jgi:signal transduction histidine kinase